MWRNLQKHLNSEEKYYTRAETMKILTFPVQKHEAMHMWNH